MDYLRKLKTLIAEVQPEWMSDHLCWTGVHGYNSHDLLPVPYNEEAINHIVDRVQQAQDFLGRQLVLENVSSYITYNQSEMEEWDFINAVAKNPVTSFYSTLITFMLVHAIMLFPLIHF